MYSRVLRTILNVSTNLKNQKLYKNASLTLPAVTLIVQKVFPNHHSLVRHYSSSDDENLSDEEIFNISKDPTERKYQIDERAQAQIDAMIAEKPELEKFMKILELEINVMRQDGEQVPDQLRPRHWVELLLLKNFLKRKKYLNYLFIIEKQQEKRKQLQQENMLKLEQIREERKNNPNDSGEIIYGVGQNSMFRRIVETTMNQLWTWNSLKSIMYGNKLVFDCSYEPLMNQIEIKSCAKQIMESYALNRIHNHPFEIILCNVNLSGHLIEKLLRYIPTLLDADFPMTVTSKSYLELYDRSSLVYLTSNAPKMMDEYEANSIYIIGALVDKGPKLPVTLGKAKKENLRMVKLPLDKFAKFGDGSGKDLTLNQVCGFMLEAQVGDWEKAASYVPRRKLYEARLHNLEKKLQRDILQRTKTLNEGYVEKDEMFSRPKFQSADVNDYSHAARAKLREQWNK